MIVTPVDSTTLASIAYDPALQVLHLRFRTSTVYCYFGVPQDVYDGLKAADSQGAYFNRNIRTRFPYRKLSMTQHERYASGSAQSYQDLEMSKLQRPFGPEQGIDQVGKARDFARANSPRRARREWPARKDASNA